MDGWLCGEKQFLLFTYRSILVKNIKLMYHMFEVNVCYSLIIDQSIVFSPLDRFGSWYKTSTDPRWPASEYPGWDTGQWHVATVCDILGCNVHTHTRNEWPKWLCGEYECALVSIVRPFTWYTLYHYYWYAASYGTIRVNQVVRKRYQCFVWRLVGAAIAKCGDNEDTGASRVENMLRVLAARQWSQQLSKCDVDVHQTFACKYLTWWYLRIFAKLIACQWRFCRQVYKFLAADSSSICPKVVCLSVVCCLWSSWKKLANCLLTAC